MKTTVMATVRKNLRAFAQVLGMPVSGISLSQNFKNSFKIALANDAPDEEATQAADTYARAMLASLYVGV